MKDFRGVSGSDRRDYWDCLSDDDNIQLTRDAAEEEILQAVRQTKPLKALGPDDKHAILS